MLQRSSSPGFHANKVTAIFTRLGRRLLLLLSRHHAAVSFRRRACGFAAASPWRQQQQQHRAMAQPRLQPHCVRDVPACCVLWSRGTARTRARCAKGIHFWFYFHQLCCCSQPPVSSSPRPKKEATVTVRACVGGWGGRVTVTVTGTTSIRYRRWFTAMGRQ